MQEVNIQFQGINLSFPPDTCIDGQLETCVGLEMHNGSLRPSLLQGTEYTLPSSYSDVSLNTIHATSQYSHFIFLSSDRLTAYWADVEQGTLQMAKVTELQQSIADVKCIGNTLILLTGEGMHYCLFKEGAYKYIGQKPPETVIQFTLVSELYTHTGAEFVLKHENIVSDSFQDRLYSDTGYMELKEEWISELTLKENLLATKLVDEASGDGRIIYPVLVRYAYRLYDGTSFIMQSSPILLVPNTDVAPVVSYRAKKGDNTYSSISAMANASLIVYNIRSAELEDWKDIITSVDIFMTDQLYSRKMDAEVTHVIRFSESEAAKSMNYGIFPVNPNHYGPKTLYDTWKNLGSADENDSNGYVFSLYGENLKTGDFSKSISEAALFYKVRSIPVQEIPINEDTYLFDNDNVSSITLRTLTLQETLPDDYQSHDQLVPGNSFVYNSRLNIVDIKRKMFGGYDTTSMVANVQTDGSEVKYYTIYTHIKKGVSEIVVKNTCSGVNGFYPMYLFYPDPDAYMMTIVEAANPDPSMFYDGWRFSLNKHPFLNGAVWFNSFIVPKNPFRRIYPPHTTESVVLYENQLAISEVDNPYVFPLSGRNTVGTGKIVGLSSIVTPLSTGQFGTFDLMIFTEEGNYAATINSEGKLSAINPKPMQRDVCINPSAIVPTDYTILYTSAKGLMSANGNTIESLSEPMNGTFEEYNYPEWENILSSCKIAYDYSGQRIIVSPQKSLFSFVRSMDGLWSMAKWGEVTSVLNVYPYSYIQRGTSLIRLDKPYNYKAGYSEGRIVTRPLKLGSLQMKSIHQLAVEGVLGEIQELVLYASHDAVTWTRIGSTQSSHIRRMAGRPFKYWKMELNVRFNGAQNISGARLQVQHRNEERYR